MPLSDISMNWDTRNRLIGAIESFFDKVRSLHDRDSHGGYFCVAHGTTGDPLFISGIGKVHQDKIQRYLAFAQEKARRLASHPDSWSSAYSRDIEKEQYAGAIRIRDEHLNLILSFSGLPEELDEAVVLTAAVKCRLLLHSDALRIAMIGSPFHQVCAGDPVTLGIDGEPGGNVVVDPSKFDPTSGDPFDDHDE